MSVTWPSRLSQGVVLAGIALAIVWSTDAQAQVREARMCTTQTETLSNERIAACTRIMNTSRLQGKPLGVAYGLRGLAFLDRGDIPHAIADLNRAVELAPDFAPAYQNRGNAWYARGNYGQALADYDKTIALDPNSPSPYVNRAAVRRDLGYNDGALEDYQKAINLRANHAGSYSGRGQLYLRQKDYARAVGDFDHSVRLDPSADNYMLRAKAHEASGELDAALHDYQEASRLHPKNVAPLNAQAALWHKKGNLDKAIAALDRAVPLDDNPSLTYRMRAEAYRDKGDRKHAYADIGRALKFSWSVNGLKVRGHLRLQDGDSDGALHDADSMLKIEADNLDAIALRALAYASKKDYARALPDLNKIIATDANNVLAFAARGQVYLAKNDGARALTDFNRAIDLHVVDAAPYRARASIYKSKGDAAKAMSDLDQAIKLDSRPAEPYFERAGLRKDNGKIDQALADLNDGLSRQPDNVAALKTRAQIKQSKGDAAGALSDYDAVLAREPKNTGMLRARAEVLIQTKSHAKAIDDLDRVIRLEPRDAKTYYQRGLAHEQAEQPDMAIADYKMALTHDRNLSEAHGALARAMAEQRKRQTHVALREDKAEPTPMPMPMPAAKPEITPQAKPDITASTPATAEKAAKRQDRKAHETARERTKREFERRKQARHERAIPTVRQRPHELSPSEKRRLYFEALEQRRRAEQNRRRQDTRFTDIWPDRR